MERICDKLNGKKSFLSSKFSMKDLGEADVILCIRIKRDNETLILSQSHYIENVLKKFNVSDCSFVSTPMDPSEKNLTNDGNVVS